MTTWRRLRTSSPSVRSVPVESGRAKSGARSRRSGTFTDATTHPSQPSARDARAKRARHTGMAPATWGRARPSRPLKGRGRGVVGSGLRSRPWDEKPDLSIVVAGGTGSVLQASQDFRELLLMIGDVATRQLLQPGDIGLRAVELASIPRDLGGDPERPEMI